MIKLNDLVSFVRFSLIDTPPPHIKTSGPINRLLQQMHITDRSTESFHTTEILLIPQTSNFAVSLTLKNRTVTESDLLTPTARALTETCNRKNLCSKLSKPSICDRCMCKVKIHLKKNCRGSSRHKITGIL